MYMVAPQTNVFGRKGLQEGSMRYKTILAVDTVNRLRIWAQII